jgi:hypothetical protein
MIPFAVRSSHLVALWHLAALVLYVAFAAYLYQPYFGTLVRWQWLMPLSAVLGSIGAYFLSRRWVSGFTGSFLAGLLYGFGPFMLSLARYHPSVVALSASIPWLCAPAAILGRRRHGIVFLVLSLLPFIAIIAFFRVCATVRLFVTPVQSSPHLEDALGMVAPLVMFHRSAAVVSVYHVAIAPLILGLAVMIRARRYNVFVPLVAGLLLAFCRSYLGPAQLAWLGVSPVLWLSIPALWLAVWTAVGFQTLMEAGFADRKWILTAAICLGGLAIVTLLLATKYFQVIFHLADGYARLFVEEAKMYLLAAVGVAIVFAIVHRQLRLHWLRWAILCAALGLDIFLGARYFIDKIF